MPLYTLGEKVVLMSKNIDGLIVDTREHSRIEPCKEYFKKKNIPVKTKRLDYGDYVFDGRVCFEFKTWEDFLSSMNDKSLFEEVYNQADYYDWSYLIICGDRDEAVGKNFYVNPAMRRRFKTARNYYGFIDASVDGAIRRCRVVCNVITVDTLDDAFHEMFEQAKKCLGNKRYGGTVRKGGVGVASPVEHFLDGIRGFGVKTVDKFVDCFSPKSLDDLLNVTGDDLVREGFNKDKVKNYCLYVYGEYDVQDEEE